MNSLFEYSDSLRTPYESFLFDTATANFPIHPHWHYFMEIIYMIEGTAIMNCYRTGGYDAFSSLSGAFHLWCI